MPKEVKKKTAAKLYSVDIVQVANYMYSKTVAHYKNKTKVFAWKNEPQKFQSFFISSNFHEVKFNEYSVMLKHL